MELLPLDRAVLALLPDEGMVMAHHNIGKTVRSLVETLGDGVTPPQVNARLRSMKRHGLVIDVTVMPVGDGRGWQITKEGRARRDEA